MMRKGSLETHIHTHTHLWLAITAALIDIIIIIKQESTTAPLTVRLKNSENLTCLSFAWVSDLLRSRGATGHFHL